MNLLEQISAELNEALKAKDDVKVSTLRFLISGLNNAKIAKGGELTDEEVVREIGKEAKRHKESISAFEAGGRTELVEKEKAELAILEKYLPAQLSEAELEKMVDEAITASGASGIGDMGKVIGQVMGRAGASADGTVVAQIAKQKLGIK